MWRQPEAAHGASSSGGVERNSTVLSRFDLASGRAVSAGYREDRQGGSAAEEEATHGRGDWAQGGERSTGTCYTTAWEYSTRRCLKGFSDAIIPGLHAADEGSWRSASIGPCKADRRPPEGWEETCGSVGFHLARPRAELIAFRCVRVNSRKCVRGITDGNAKRETQGNARGTLFMNTRR